MNLSHYVTLVSIYINVLFIVSLFVFLPIAAIISIFLPDTNNWKKVIYVLKKTFLVSVWSLVAIHFSVLSVWIISLFVGALPSLDIFLTLVKMFTFTSVIWTCALLLYCVVFFVLSIFGISIFSISQIKKQLLK
jgi:hypothetical protein